MYKIVETVVKAEEIEPRLLAVQIVAGLLLILSGVLLLMGAVKVKNRQHWSTLKKIVSEGTEIRSVPYCSRRYLFVSSYNRVSGYTLNFPGQHNERRCYNNIYFSGRTFLANLFGI